MLVRQLTITSTWCAEVNNNEEIYYLSGISNCLYASCLDIYLLSTNQPVLMIESMSLNIVVFATRTIVADLAKKAGKRWPYNISSYCSA